MCRRLGIRHPLANQPREIVRARVRALWKAHPEFTANQVIASLGPECPLGTTRAWRLLKECREAAVRRCPMHRRTRWRLDHRTATRIRIAAVRKRHPQWTARQVIGELGHGSEVTIPWVQKVLRECWRASRRHGPKHRLRGRRRYNRLRERSRCPVATRSECGRDESVTTRTQKSPRQAP